VQCAVINTVKLIRITAVINLLLELRVRRFQYMHGYSVIA